MLLLLQPSARGGRWCAVAAPALLRLQQPRLQTTQARRLCRVLRKYWQPCKVRAVLTLYHSVVDLCLLVGIVFEPVFCDICHAVYVAAVAAAAGAAARRLLRLGRTDRRQTLLNRTAH
jgi:hypothetical protein